MMSMYTTGAQYIVSGGREIVRGNKAKNNNVNSHVAINVQAKPSTERKLKSSYARKRIRNRLKNMFEDWSHSLATHLHLTSLLISSAPSPFPCISRRHAHVFLVPSMPAS